ncbi:hypothetical protein DCAR_0832479 [Daucus carota subsp. sativus]|uniref:Uncharacterized protein n=1 Tax=Daucus carota subsp. sativus TaxID=79200 RepID=A0A175YP43_DAUCS|nr:hypothetical protein DCAR_0832479 [Daucus carota subsp. sativus]
MQEYHPNPNQRLESRGFPPIRLSIVIVKEEANFDYSKFELHGVNFDDELELNEEVEDELFGVQIEEAKFEELIIDDKCGFN